MKPEWLKIRISGGAAEREEVFSLLERLSLHTVCEEAACPNLCECFGRGTATFMLLGDTCTRNCTFCNVKKGMPGSVDHGEPEAIARAVAELHLRHVVVTSVTRDDLPDGGASHFTATVSKIREICPDVTIETLVPDFMGKPGALFSVIRAQPDVLNHNLETVPELYPSVRPAASYEGSLALLAEVRSADASILTKSGLMLGLGESREQLLAVFGDLVQAGCDMLTLGQYLRPSGSHHEVCRYVHPDEFEELKGIALDMGFRHVASGPFVRSSWRAGEGVGLLKGLPHLANGDRIKHIDVNIDVNK